MPEDEYTFEEITVLQAIWGEGFLSPGGQAHLDEIVHGLDLADKLVLDIGCAVGGYDVLLAQNHGARVIGLDVEAPLVRRGQERVRAAGLEGQVDLRVYPPGPLPFEAQHFDVVFSKDSWLHIEDKPSFFEEVYRVLKPGGVVAASDWCCKPGPFSKEMFYFFEIEGLTYHMEPLADYGRYLEQAGFVDVELKDIHAIYRAMAHEELQRMKTTLKDELVPKIGQKWYDHYVEDWRAIVTILDTGDLQPGRMRARRPG